MSSFNIKFAAVSIMTLSLTGISGALADGASCAAGNVSQSTLRTELYQISQLVNAACVSRGQLPATLADAGYVQIGRASCRERVCNGV